MCIHLRSHPRSLTITLTPAARGDETHNNPAIFLEAAKFVNDHVEINRDFDIPYLAGMAREFPIIYIDRHTPSSFRWNGRTWLTDQYLALHEWQEHLLSLEGGGWIDRFKSYMFHKTKDPRWKVGPSDKFPYAYAHQFAQHLELMKVLYDGLLWDPYSAFMDGFIKKAGSEKLTKCPPDLYIQPYEQDAKETGDMTLLEQIFAAGGPQSERLTKYGEAPGDDGSPTYENS